MKSFSGSAFAGSLGWSATTIVVLLLATFVVGKIIGKHSVLDTTWGLLFVAVSIVVFCASAGHGNSVRRWVLLILPVSWGLRLAWHIGRRSVGKPEDPRYKKMLETHAGDLAIVRNIYAPQGLVAFIIAAPIMIGGFQRQSAGPLLWVGVVVWATGLVFETVGDAQLERFRADPDHKGGLIESGLWRYTRHPNYFGDACAWWGIFLVAADPLPGWFAIISPIMMTLLLTVGSGARILERSMCKRPGWDEYAARTSMFFPLPSKRQGSIQ